MAQELQGTYMILEGRQPGVQPAAGVQRRAIKTGDQIKQGRHLGRVRHSSVEVPRRTVTWAELEKQGWTSTQAAWTAEQT